MATAAAAVSVDSICANFSSHDVAPASGIPLQHTVSAVLKQSQVLDW